MKILIAIIALLCLAVAAYGGQYPAKVVTGTITMLSAQTASTYSLGSAASYCDNLTAAPDIVLDGSTDATIYDDWRLMSFPEITNFIGRTTSTTRVWTTTAKDSAATQYITQEISLAQSLGWSNDASTSFHNVRCGREGGK